MTTITAYVRSVSSVVQNGVTMFYLTLKPAMPAHAYKPASNMYKALFTACEHDYSHLIPLLACLIPDQIVEVTYVGDMEVPLAPCFDPRLKLSIVNIKVAP